jgi:hypothetical protein
MSSLLHLGSKFGKRVGERRGGTSRRNSTRVDGIFNWSVPPDSLAVLRLDILRGSVAFL